MRSLSEIVDEIKRIKNIKNRTKVAEILDVDPKALNTAISRKSNPYLERIITFCSKEGVSIDWLLTGETPGAAPAHPPEVQEYVNRLIAILERAGGPAEYVKGVIDSKYQECRETTAEYAAEDDTRYKAPKKGA